MNAFFRKIPAATLITALLLAPRPLLACAACFGQSNDQMAVGMNWGIASLLVVIVGVLGGIASFFVYIARKSSTVPGPEDSSTTRGTPNQKNQ